MHHLARRALAVQAQHRALAHEGLNARDAELGGFLDQRIHALVGRHADGERHAARQLAIARVVRAHVDRHGAAPDRGDAGGPFAAAPVEQRDGSARLQAQHLHMARWTGRQHDTRAAGQRQVVHVEAGRGRHAGPPSTRNSSGRISQLKMI